MDGFRFDDLARAVAGGTSRRSVLKGLAATVAAATMAVTSRLTSSMPTRTTASLIDESTSAPHEISRARGYERSPIYLPLSGGKPPTNRVFSDRLRTIAREERGELEGK